MATKTENITCRSEYQGGCGVSHKTIEAAEAHSARLNRSVKAPSYLDYRPYNR